MGALFDSFWRAAVYCMHPRVVVLSLLPLILIGGLALVLSRFYWEPAVGLVSAWLDSFAVLGRFKGWLEGLGFDQAVAYLAPLVVIALVAPLVVVSSLLLVAVLMTPALITLVSRRRFRVLEQKKGGSFFLSMAWSLGSTAMALVALVLSMPLWLVPPLILILPPLIWGWLTYRVMAFDALAEHASRAERVELFRRHRMTLLAMGVICGFLGAAPAIVWASGVLFVAAFFVMIPLAVWIYTLVFAFSSLWFAHFCLAALERLRNEAKSEAVLTPTPRAVVPDTVQPLAAPDQVPLLPGRAES